MKIFFLFLAISLTFAQETSPKGNIFSAEHKYGTKHISMGITIPDKLNKQYQLPTPSPRRSDCSDKTCFVVLGVAVDPKKNRAFVVVENLPEKTEDGKQIHLYQVTFHPTTLEITDVKTRVMLDEHAKKHVFPNTFLEGLTFDEENEILYVHLFQSHVFSVKPNSNEEKLAFKYNAWQPNTLRTYFNQKTKKWSTIDSFQRFYVVDSKGKSNFTRELTEGMEYCPTSVGRFTFDASTGFHFFSCELFDKKNIRMMKVKENIKESTFEDILSRFQIPPNDGIQFTFAEEGVLFIVTSGAAIKGYNVKSGKQVYKNKVPFTASGKYYYYVSEKNSVKLLK